MRRLFPVLLAVAALAGCGGDPVVVDDQGEAASSGWAGVELTPEPGFDPDDPSLQTIPDDEAHADEIIRKAGKRRDYKVPVSAVAGLRSGPLVRAVVLRPFYELSASAAGLRRLNDGQRAVHAMYLADFEILNGGFSQLWFNVPAGISNELLPAAERVGSPEFAAIYRDAAALWPGGKVPRDRAQREALLETLDGEQLAELDERYAATQYRRKTALATVLAPYIRANADEFVAY